MLAVQANCCSTGPVQCLEWITVPEQLFSLWVSFVLAGLYVLSRMYCSLCTEYIWNGFLVDCSVGFITLLTTGVSSTVPLGDEMVGSVPALQVANLEVDKAQRKAEVLIFLFGSVVFWPYAFKLLTVTLDLKHWISFFFLECSCRCLLFLQNRSQVFYSMGLHQKKHAATNHEDFDWQGLAQHRSNTWCKTAGVFSFLQCSTQETALLSKIFLSWYVFSTLTK